MSDSANDRHSCPYCGGTGSVHDNNGQVIRCERCGATIYMKDWTIEVKGEDASEVEQVSSSLMIKAHNENNSIRNPWITGSIYLACIVIIETYFLIVKEEQ